MRKIGSMGYERWVISPDLEAKMRDVARQLRSEPTPTEGVLWEKLRRKQIGHKFRRQAPIGPFIVDFLCPTANLIIEVDGPIHESQQKADQERQALIENLGLRFLRVSNEDIEHNLSEVIAKIQIALIEQTGSSSS